MSTMSRFKRQRLTTPDTDHVGLNDNEAERSDTKVASQPAKTKQATEQQGRSLYVRSLPVSVTTESLTNLFSQSFPLKHATVVVDPVTKKSKGYGFVTFADVEDAQSAIKAFSGSVLEGQKIKVELAEPRQRRLNENGSVNANKKTPRPNRQKPEALSHPKLIVRNLPWTAKESELAALFRSYGKVILAAIPRKEPGLSPGFGFVVLRGRKNAEKALEGVNGKEIEGRTLAVDWAVDKEVWNTLNIENEKPELSHEVDGGSAKVRDGKASRLERIGNENSTGTSQIDASASSASDNDSSEDTSNSGKASEEETTLRTLRNDSSTLFLRNVPFSCSDEMLKEHFQFFGPVRYARIVLDQATERSKGTGFVCFVNAEDADTCLREAHQMQLVSGQVGSLNRSANASSNKYSLLEDTSKDFSGRFTIDGRVLQVSRAVDRGEATRLTFAGNNIRDVRDKDKRRLFLLSEGTVPADTPLYGLLSATDIKMREDSARQRQSLIRSNPALHLSLTRLSIRNLPRHITSKDLKALAREAVVGFAKDVKSEARKPLSKEERSRGGEGMREAEKARKAKGKGIVKQATVHFEGREGGKVAETNGAGRSRGYVFVEYTSHQWALKGLRWLNGHAVGVSNGTAAGSEIKERKKRLIVEFAVENTQVVDRRHEREAKARERSKLVSEKRQNGDISLATSTKTPSKDQLMAKTRKGMKRKRSPGSDPLRQRDTSAANMTTKDSDESSKRQRIIGRKRMIRKSRGKASAG